MTRLIAVVAFVAFAFTSATLVSSKTLSSVTFKMRAENKSGEKGTATLTPQGFGTKVTITLTGEPPGASQPAHIHTGTCQAVGGVVYPLSNVVGGTSTTFINKPIGVIKMNGAIVNVHKSAAQITQYVSCGKW